MSCRWKSFEPFMARNRERYRMYAVTLPGIAQTPAPDLPLNGDEPVWHRNAIQALSNLIDRERLTNVMSSAIPSVRRWPWGSRARARDADRRTLSRRRSRLAGLPNRRELDSPSSVVDFSRATDAAEYAAARCETLRTRGQPVNVPQIADRGRMARYHGWSACRPKSDSAVSILAR